MTLVRFALLCVCVGVFFSLVECGHLHADGMDEGDDEDNEVEADKDMLPAAAVKSEQDGVPRERIHAKVKREQDTGSQEHPTTAAQTHQGGSTHAHGRKQSKAHEERLCTLVRLLGAQFGKATHTGGDRILIQVDELEAVVYAQSELVQCEDEELRTSVQNALVMAKIAVYPLSVESVDGGSLSTPATNPSLHSTHSTNTGGDVSTTAAESSTTSAPIAAPTTTSERC
jgi:Pre-mRNA 3'-end-processing endonuclease polyadenylation factor C-term